jgi:hypothetical protein
MGREFCLVKAIASLWKRYRLKIVYLCAKLIAKGQSLIARSISKEAISHCLSDRSPEQRKYYQYKDKPSK